MSEQWTPKADDFRQVWAAFNGYGGLVTRPHSVSMDEGYAEFERWLEQERAVARREGQAEAWADAIGEAYDCGWIHDYGRDEMIDRNPFEPEEDRHVDQ